MYIQVNVCMHLLCISVLMHFFQEVQRKVKRFLLHFACNYKAKYRSPVNNFWFYFLVFMRERLV